MVSPSTTHVPHFPTSFAITGEESIVPKLPKNTAGNQTAGESSNTQHPSLATLQGKHSTISRFEALGISDSKKEHQQREIGTVKLKELIADTKAYIAELEKRTEMSGEGVECFHQKTDDLISINKGAPSGNKRLIVESFFMLNASREKTGEPPIFFAYDIHNVFLHLETLQKKCGTTLMQPLRKHYVLCVNPMKRRTIIR